MTLGHWLGIIVPTMGVFYLLSVAFEYEKRNWGRLVVLLCFCCTMWVAAMAVKGYTDWVWEGKAKPVPRYEPVQEQLYRLKQ